MTLGQAYRRFRVVWALSGATELSLAMAFWLAAFVAGWYGDYLIKLAERLL